MKKLKVSLVTVFSLLTLSISSLLFVSCSQDNDDLGVNNAEILNYANQFAEIHNEFLSYAFSQEKQTPILKSDGVSLIESLIDIADRFIEKKQSVALKNSSAQNTANIDVRACFEYKTIEEIENEMSERELLYAKKTMKLLSQSLDLIELNYLKKEVIGDILLTEKQKYAICALISTAEKSYEFWHERTTIVTTVKGGSIPRLKSGSEYIYDGWWERNNHIVGADAYMGWWMTLGSGGNLLCGAVCAGIASFCAAS